jgi:hypothetical protein
MHLIMDRVLVRGGFARWSRRWGAARPLVGGEEVGDSLRRCGELSLAGLGLTAPLVAALVAL